jgi:ribosomal protein S3AE
MNKRITITIDESIDSKIRQIQAEKITATNSSISFSQVINEILKGALNTTNFKSISP